MDPVAGRARRLALAKVIKQGVPELGGFGPECQSLIVPSWLTAAHRPVQQVLEAARQGPGVLGVQNSTASAAEISARSAAASGGRRSPSSSGLNAGSLTGSLTLLG